MFRITEEAIYGILSKENDQTLLIKRIQAVALARKYIASASLLLALSRIYPCQAPLTGTLR
jgi:hypothetical protein